ncbi:MAG TPA: phosphoribosylformylglycinamidine cyclo-ligase [Thermoplasmata archaeon]|nr:phosphoribosylformylglycinamidine cyclo-ligase [Thermoplasmata archaeon]
MARRAGWTYARAGVDRGSVSASLAALLAGTHYRPPANHGRLLDLPGHYAGLVRIGRETIAVTTDTVGTKVLLAEQLGRWEGVGEDIVQVNVNDLAAVGARPSVLVDCVLCERPDPAVFRAIGRGLGRGLRKGRIALAGGETAVVPDIVRGTDLGGTAVGFFPKGRRPVTGAAIRPGDVVLGVPASGFHANGFTLVRKLLSEGSVSLSKPRPGARSPLGEELLRPGRIYVDAAEAIADRRTTHGLAHISGGGVRNLVRLNPDVRFELDRWPAPAGLYQWVAELGAIAPEELYQTFNLGIGFVAVVLPGAAWPTLAALTAAGVRDTRVVGRVGKGSGVALPQVGLEYSGYA